MLTQDRAEQIAKSINAVLTGYEAEVVPSYSGSILSSDYDSGENKEVWCVIVYEKDPQLAIICIFDDGEVLYEAQEATRVIEDWDQDSREWLVRTIAAEVYAEREAQEGAQV